MVIETDLQKPTLNELAFTQLIKNKPDIISLKKMIQDPAFFKAPKGIKPRRHSRDLDKILGFKISKIEQKLLKKYRAYDKPEDYSNKKQHYNGTQTWIGLHPDVLQTPYSEILQFLNCFRNTDPKTIVDFGAAYGRMGLVTNALFPNSQFIGYEILDVRANEAQRVFELLDLRNCKMRNENILEDSFEVPDADIYFIYDFSYADDLNIILKKLSKKFETEKFFLVAKGEFVLSLIQSKFPEFWVNNEIARHHLWSIYSSY